MFVVHPSSFSPASSVTQTVFGHFLYANKIFFTSSHLLHPPSSLSPPPLLTSLQERRQQILPCLPPTPASQHVVCGRHRPNMGTAEERSDGREETSSSTARATFSWRCPSRSCRELCRRRRGSCSCPSPFSRRCSLATNFRDDAL